VATVLRVMTLQNGTPMSDEKAVFHQGRWWVQQHGDWLVYFGGAWVQPSEVSSRARSVVAVAGLATGVVGVVVALFRLAITGALLFLLPATALALGFGAVITRRKTLAIWALVLGAVTFGVIAWGVGVSFGLLSVEAFYTGTPTLIGAAAIGLSTTGLTARNGRAKAAAVLGLVLGITTVVYGVWGRGLYADWSPRAPVPSQTKPTMFGALDASGT
jgi:hypothetical protein